VEPPPILIRSSREKPRSQAKRRHGTLVLISGLCFGAILASFAISSWLQREKALVAETSTDLLELLEEIDSAAEIVLVSPRPYRLPPIEFEDRDISIKAGRGITPVLRIEFEEMTGDAAVLIENGSLTLEGIVLESVFPDVYFEQSDHFAEDEEFDPSELIACDQGDLTAANCRFVHADGGGGPQSLDSCWG